MWNFIHPCNEFILNVKCFNDCFRRENFRRQSSMTCGLKESCIVPETRAWQRDVSYVNMTLNGDTLLEPKKKL
jgi:hypothetical protein